MNQGLCDRAGSAGALLAALVIACGCTPEPAPTGDVIRPVKKMVVASGNESHVRSFPGVVEASRRVELAFQVPGLLVRFPVREGQQIAKGELIGQLRQDEFQARLTSLQGQLDRARAALVGIRSGERQEEQLRRQSQVRAAEARLANARAALDRSTNLLTRGAASRAQVELDETAYHVAEEDLQAARQLLEKSMLGREEEIDAQEAEVRSLEG